MVNYSQIHTNELDLLFQSLSDATRRGILERLTNKSLTVSEIAAPYNMSLPAISKHIAILERAQLIKRSKKGREYHVTLEPDRMKTISEYIEYYKKFWEQGLQNLERLLNKESSQEKNEKSAGNNK